MLGNFSDTGGSVLSDKSILIFQAVEDLGEGFSHDNNTGKFAVVFGDLGQTVADLSLELSVTMGDQRGQERSSSMINDGLSKFG